MIIKQVIFFLIALWIFQSPLEAQTLLKGRVKDNNQNPLSNINILVYPHGKQNLIAFGFSRGDGTFQINLHTTADSLRLEATSLHFRTDSLLVANISQEVVFNLLPEIKDLSEFVVRAKPIVQRGDTISYLVSSFAREQDRVIADVLQRMPGIEVEPSGRILYQGEPIQHFYVEGLDLMGGRYGLVSNNLPHRSVATVQILENHQPIRILEERIPSHRTSLNLTLKREVTTTGTARLGSGLTPLLWDANTTPMMFTRNFQLAGSYQANNTGHDAAKQLDVLTIESLRSRMEGNLSRPSLLSTPLLSPPGFNENRHLDNNLHMVNANALQRLSGDFQLRANLYFIYDNQRQQGNTRRTIYTPTDTLAFDETTRNNLNDRALRGEITLIRNTPNNFLNNKLEFQSHWDKRNVLFSSNANPLAQELRNPFQSLSNRLSTILPVGERLIQFNSQLQFDHSPHRLSLTPGSFEGVFNNGQPFDGISQNIRLQRFASHHSASLSMGWRHWSITPRVGIQYMLQNLQSQIETQNTVPIELLPGSFNNNLDGNQTRAYLQTEFVYNKRGSDFNFSVDIPISYVSINVKDDNLMRGQKINRILVEPRLSAGYRIGDFWRVRGSYGFRHHFGEMDNIHYAWMLANHRTLQINDAPLQQGTLHSFSAFIGHRNPFLSFFSSLGYSFSVRNSNLLFSNEIFDNGTSLVVAVEQPNTSYTHNFSGSSSKFFPGISSTFSIQANYSMQNQQLWVNDQTFRGQNHVYMIDPRANIRFAEWLNVELSTQWLHFRTTRDRQTLNSVSLFKHQGNLVIFPARNQHIAIYGEYYQHANRHNYFVDISYRYTITRHRIDIDVRWVNIFNHKTFRDYQVGMFSFMENEYNLRPSQLVLLVRFSF